MSWRINFNRQQWITVITFLIVNFCNAMCVSMQAPFYPQEAEKKGCVPSEYGLVFGVFELTVFIVSPIIGANLNRLGMKATLTIGIGTVGVTSILFGLLDRIENGKIFLALSFTLRIVEACGNSGFLTGSFSMIAKEFPSNVATMFAILETSFGIGMIMGPTIGGALYEVGGFTLPFASLGAVLVGAAIFSAVILPRAVDGPGLPREKPSMLQAIKVPSIVMACYSVACSAASLGFIHATLEPHLRDFKLSPMQVGAFFVISGVTYGSSAPIWGIICDRKPPKAVTAVGAILITIGFCLMGPLPFLPVAKSIPLIVVALLFHGIGLGAEVVAGFADAHKQAILSGFPDTIDTYGLISGLWTSVFALGAFIGPTVAGLLFDAVGFPMGTLFVIVAHLLALLFLTGFLASHVFRKRRDTTFPETIEEEPSEGDVLLPTSYGAISGPDDARQNRRQRTPRRTRKFSEAVSGSMSLSLATSVSKVYPHFIMPGVATSYRNPPPSYAHGALAGSTMDHLGLEADNLIQVSEDN